MRAESELEKESPNVSDIISLLQQMRNKSKEQVRQLEFDLGRSVEACHEKVEELTTLSC